MFTRLSDVFYLMKAVKLSRNVVFSKNFCRLFVNVLSEVCFPGVKVMSLKLQKMFVTTCDVHKPP